MSDYVEQEIMEQQMSEMRQMAVEERMDFKNICRKMRKNETERYLGMEAKNMDPPVELGIITPDYHGYYHINFKTPKWQEWWGEGFYRRDGNDTPKSPEPEVAKLQELFATVKRRHQENQQQWRKELTEYLLGMETKNLPVPDFTRKYSPFYLTFEIPFKTVEYQKWWDMELRSNDEDEDLPARDYSPFEVKFLDVAHKIHMALFERRLGVAESMINELSTMVDEDRNSIPSSIASNFYSRKTPNHNNNEYETIKCADK